MNREEHQDRLIALKAKAKAAEADGRWGEAMLIAGEVFELILEHPEFWPDNVDHTKLRSDCERMIAMIDKKFGIS
jgi:hypothetical protein